MGATGGRSGVAGRLDAPLRRQGRSRLPHHVPQALKPAAFLSLFLAVAAIHANASPGTAVCETAHYRVEVEGSESEAREAGKVLEAAWPQFREFFQAEPDLEDGELLEVFVARTKPGFVSKLRADGAAVPDSGGYYSPKTRTAYLWRQPTIYNTRCLLIHEASHQFHYLSRTGNRSVSVWWYVEGMAEYLGRHWWDGETLTLGVLPFVSLSDYAAKATGKEPELDALVSGKATSRPLAWALVRYFQSSKRLEKRFGVVAKKYDRGAGSAGLFKKSFGSPGKVSKALAEWLREEQEPWCQIFNEWEGIGPGRFHGTAPGAIVSAARVKRDVMRLGAVLELPEQRTFRGGLLLHHDDRGGYTVALIQNGRTFYVDRRVDGKWVRLGAGECPPSKTPGRIRLEAVRTAGKVSLRIEGREVDSYALPGSRLGLALQGSDLLFSEVEWE